MDKTKAKEALGRKSRMIGSRNRLEVLATIVIKPSAFSELLKETNLSRASLTLHLKNLRKEGKIERAILNDKIVYQIKPQSDENLMAMITQEITEQGSLVIAKIFSNISPTFNDKIKEAVENLARDIIKRRKEQPLKEELKN